MINNEEYEEKKALLKAAFNEAKQDYQFAYAAYNSSQDGRSPELNCESYRKLKNAELKMNLAYNALAQLIKKNMKVKS